MNNLQEIENQIKELKETVKLTETKIKELEVIESRYYETIDLEKNIMYSLINKYKPSLTVKTDFSIDYDKPRRSGIHQIQLNWTNDEYEETTCDDFNNCDDIEINTEETELCPIINNLDSCMIEGYENHLKHFDEFVNNYKPTFN